MVKRDKRKIEMEIEKKDLFLKTLHADANVPFFLEESITNLRQIHAKYLQSQPQHSPRYQEAPQSSRNSREQERPGSQPRQDSLNSRA